MLSFFKKLFENNRICAICDGEIFPLEEVNDEVFSQKMVGDGIAIHIESDRIVAPANGEITMFFPTMHAFGMKTAEGIEMLIHIGLDSVSLNGKGFSREVGVGDMVHAGDQIMTVDRKVLAENHIDNTSVIIFTKTSGHEMSYVRYGRVRAGIDIVASCERKRI